MKLKIRQSFQLPKFFSPLFLLVCIGLLSFHIPSSAQNQSKPNVILFVADDLGYGDLGCYGQKDIPTPNLDKLAAEGTRFTQFYSGSTVCAPSRCALMTGLDMGHAYIRGNNGLSLRESDVTIAKIAKQQGYTTGMFGKWGLGEEGSAGVPDKQGWDVFLGYLNQRHAHNYYVKNLLETREGKTVHHPMDTTQNTAPYIFKAALHFVEENKDKPFFLYLPVTLPHAEMTIPTEEAVQPFLRNNGKSIFPEVSFVKGTGMSTTYSSQEMPNAATAAMIRQIDLDMGKLMRLLKELGIDKNTYIFFTSDNGPHQEGGRNIKQFESTAGLRGYKRDLYEGGLRVPTLAWGPNARVKVSDEPLGNWDFFPTITNIIGAPTPDYINGVSFLDVITGKKNSAKHATLYWEFHERGFDQAIRQGKWKAIRRSSNQLKVELYDLTRDYAENTDIADKYPELASKFEALFATLRQDSPDYPIRK